MGGITDAIGGIFGGGDDAADASRDAAKTQAAYQREALEYLKEREAIPQQYREGALGQMAGMYGLEGGDPNAASNLRNTEIFQATRGQLPQQEEAILRNQSATGALRTGGTDMMLAENQRRNELSAYQNAIGGLQGLAGLPSLAPQIAGGISGIGQTLAQGEVAAAQAQQAGGQQGFGNLLGLGQLGMSAYSAFSDRRLKSNVRKIGEADGLNIYSWTWNEDAKTLGLEGPSTGPMADEVEALYPDAVTTVNGYKHVRL